MGPRYIFDGCGINDATDLYARRIATLERNVLTPDEVRKHGLTLAASAEVLDLLRRILAAHESRNNGLVMGEAILCGYFAAWARDVIKRAEGR